MDFGQILTKSLGKKAIVEKLMKNVLLYFSKAIFPIINV
jgi:hypothetical protein